MEQGKVKIKLRETMAEAFNEVEKNANKYKTDLRTAAFIVALKRLLQK